jgi:cytochrome c peroxidase
MTQTYRVTSLCALGLLVACAGACTPDGADPGTPAPSNAATGEEGDDSISTDSQFSGIFLDHLVRTRLKQANISPVEAPPPQDATQVALGRDLFFDKELSGTRSISCGTCHHPLLGSADGQSLSRAQGAFGLGPSRVQGPLSQFLPRNAIDLWNRGTPQWTTMFWDGRLGGTRETGFFSPAGDQTPQDFTNALAAFVIIPVTPREEMRGFVDELDRLGNFNELGVIADDDFEGIWEGVMARVLAIENYRARFRDAFPAVAQDQFNIVHLANAVGAFMTDAFTALDSPFDRYLGGSSAALSDDAKRGALLFYGRASCSNCHGGNLQTDFGFHNIASPQVGGGRGADAPLDVGRERVSNDPADRFKFRTPSLRNTELTGPWMHNGAFADLEDAVRHHLNPQASLFNYDPTQVEPELVGTEVTDPAVLQSLLATRSPALAVKGPPLSNQEVRQLMAFLSSLTDPASLNQFDLLPQTVPSGLPVAD